MDETKCYVMDRWAAVDVELLNSSTVNDLFDDKNCILLYYPRCKNDELSTFDLSMYVPVCGIVTYSRTTSQTDEPFLIVCSCV